VFYVYVLIEKQTGRSYVGYSADLKARLTCHQEGRGARCTRNGDWVLAYYEAYAAKGDAVRREQRLKQNGNARHQLIERIQQSIHWMKTGAGEAYDRSTRKRRP